MRSHAKKDNRRNQVRVPGSIRELKMHRCAFYRALVCPLANRMPLVSGDLPARNSPGDFIFIPYEVRPWELSRFTVTARLEHALGYMNCRTLGDLQGRRLSDIGRWRNCGRVTLRELIRLVRNLQEGNWSNWRDPNASGAQDYYEI